MRILKISILLITVIAITSCKKAGTGGKFTITALPRHHGKTIPGSIIYIKYNAKDFPGEDVSKYDASGITEQHHGGDAHYEFEELKKGNYYLYSVGYDSSAAQIVKGGISYTVKDKEGEKDLEIPVSED